MKRLILVIATLAILLSACAGEDGYLTRLDREEVEGVECILVRNDRTDHVRAIDCNWEDANG